MPVVNLPQIVNLLSSLSHHTDLSIEQPLFIDPAKDDPEQYISFREEVPYPIDGNERGHATIEQLGLNRKELREVRLDHYRMLRTLHELLELAKDFPDDAATVEKARALLAQAVQSSAQYAGMARAAIACGFRNDLRPAENPCNGLNVSDWALRSPADRFPSPSGYPFSLDMPECEHRVNPGCLSGRQVAGNKADHNSKQRPKAHRQRVSWRKLE